MPGCAGEIWLYEFCCDGGNMVAETTEEVQDVGGLQQGGVWQLTQPRLVLSPLRTSGIVICILSGGEGGRLYQGLPG